MSEQANIKLAVPFFMVRDMQISLAFYAEKLGFKITNKWTPRGKTEWCRLQRGEVSIMLQETRNDYNGEHPGNGVSIAFQCQDALALYREFTAKGVEIREPFVGNNMWVVVFKDPDGFKLDFESPTDVPEETTYSEWLKSKA